VLGSRIIEAGSAIRWYAVVHYAGSELIRFDGSTWSKVWANGSANCAAFSLWGTSPTNVWAGGVRGSGAQPQPPTCRSPLTVTFVNVIVNVIVNASPRDPDRARARERIA